MHADSVSSFCPAPGAKITAMNPLSGVLGETWKLYKAHAAHLLVIAFVIYWVAAVLAGSCVAGY